MLLAPWQQLIFNGTVADVVRDLIGRAEIAVWNMEELLHVPDAEVGHTPGPNLPRRAETFERRDNDGQVGAPISPVREVKIQVFSPETGKARLASAHNGIFCRHVIHFGDQEYAVALAGNRAADEAPKKPFRKQRRKPSPRSMVKASGRTLRGVRWDAVCCGAECPF